jgi:hypothetical protein
LCAVLTVPPNAYIDSSGNHWSCEGGFRRSGQTCVPSET